jgi:hypothetical protein
MNVPPPNSNSGLGKPFLVTALVICLGIICLQFRMTIKLREESRFAHDQRREIERLRGENKEMTKLRRDNRELELLRAENVELVDLRGKMLSLQNLVSTQRVQLERLRGEVAVTSTNKSTNLTETAAASTDDEYIAREDWIDAGLGTPEATIETMFWATREGNFNRLLDTMAPEDARDFAAGFQSEADVELFWRVTRRGPVGRVQGYKILHVEPVSDSQVAVYLDGETNPLFLVQINGAWKMGAKP